RNGSGKVPCLQIFCRMRKLISLTRFVHLHAFEQQLQCGPIHLAGAHRPPVTDKSTGLQALAPDAKSAAIKVQALDLRTAPVDEYYSAPSSGFCPIEWRVNACNPSKDLRMSAGSPYRCTRIWP